MKQVLKKISLLVFVGIVFLTCNKKQTYTPCPDYIDTTLDSYLTNHFLFNAGSYWVYKDSIQNAIDSVTCGAKQFPHTQWYSSCGPERGQYLISITTGNNGTTKAEQYYYFIWNKSLVAYQTGNTSYLSMAVSNGSSLVTNSKVVYFPTCNVGGIIYTDVYRCSYVNHIGVGIPDSICKYLKPDVGIVRSELYFSGQKRVYNLLNYHIQ